jgi:diaminohydroxyphosphoribosylaminopyrimidine deaminase / 5-amino-6-(5-phosphoribosylamino)uracil reductase
MPKLRNQPRQEVAGQGAPSAERFMRLALRLARKGAGNTSPNPIVGAVLVKTSQVIGRGWHRRAGEPHAEIEALRDAENKGHSPTGATLYVTLEPCSTRGRTGPCTEAIIRAGISRVLVGATDPNPLHKGGGFKLLRDAGIRVEAGLLARECEGLNEAFNHWVVHRTPWVTVKAAMTLDGKIATASGESKWITGPAARLAGMKLRKTADAILVGINTILADDPSLTFRDSLATKLVPLRRIILDSLARTPLDSRVVSDENAELTTIIVSRSAPQSRVRALATRATVLVAPLRRKRQSDGLMAAPELDLRWVLKRLGAAQVTSLLVEGGGEVNASFLMDGLAHRVAFFYAPKVLGGRSARKAVAGEGATCWKETLRLEDIRWKQLGEDLFLSARVRPF